MGLALSSLFRSPSAQAKFLRLKVAVVGLAQDYWKDTPIRWPVRAPSQPKTSAPKASANSKSHPPGEEASSAFNVSASPLPHDPQAWFADRIQVMEKMWGEGHVLPGGDAYIENLITPLGITNEMSILDLAAGLGGLARKVAEDYGAFVTGMETDQTIASRGMIMSIAAGKSKQASIVAYETPNFTASRKYDRIFARELFYRVIGKEKFFKSIVSSLKTGGGQIVFTDYVLDGDAREKPAVTQWLARERNAAPLSFPEIMKYWKGFGFDMRVAEDQTDEYRMMILKGLAELGNFMTKNTPDAETKLIVMREIDLWGRRVAAFSQGLKYYRFYGIKY